MKKGGKKRGKTTKSSKKIMPSKKAKSSKSKPKEARGLFGGNKKFLAIAFISFFVFAFFLSVIPKPSFSGKAVGGTALIKEMFGGWQEGEFDAALAKYLFWGVLFLFILSVLNFANFPAANDPDKKTGAAFIRFLLALIVSFLATAYITPEEVYTVLISYTALGLALGSLVPFLILMFTSAMLVSNENIKKMRIGKLMVQVVMWMLWTAFLIYKFIKVWIEEGFETLLKGAGIIFLAVLFVSVIIVIFNKPFVKWIWGLGLRIREGKEEAISASEEAREKARKKRYE